MSLATQKWPVTSYTIKWIAIVTMLVDHVGVVCYEWLGWSERYLFLRHIGRVAFPLFALLLVEGFRYTRSRWRYLRNLLIFALVSEIPFDLVNGWWKRFQSRNIFWALCLGLLGMMGAEAVFRQCVKRHIPRPIACLCALVPMAVVVYVGEWGGVDYHGWGPLLILMVYGGETVMPLLLPDAVTPQTARNFGAAFAVLLWMTLYDVSHGWANEIYGAAAAVLILCYNGERGRYRLPKWFFYGFYPAHLLILHMLRPVLQRLLAG